MQAAARHLRPMSLASLLDTTFRIYRQNVLTFLGIAALVQVPVLLLQLLVISLFGDSVAGDLQQLMFDILVLDPDTDTLSDVRFGSLGPYIGFSLLIGLLNGLLLQVATGAYAYAAVQDYEHSQRVSILGAYGFGAGRIFNLVLASILVSILTGLLVIVSSGLLVGFVSFFGALGGGGALAGFLSLLFLIFGMLLLGLLFLFVWTCFFFVIQAVVIEGRGPLRALGRSWRLVTKAFWRVLGVVLMAWLLVEVLRQQLIQVSDTILQLFYDPLFDFAMYQTIYSIVLFTADILVLPVWLTVPALLFYDIRLRKEGYDLQMQVQQHFVENATGSSSEQPGPTMRSDPEMQG